MSRGSGDDMPESETVPEAAPAPSTLGGRLAAERAAREWTIEHVAGQLNLAPRQILALETDNYAALPGMASVRGFVRAYAKLLKIDATPLVAMIASEQITPTQPLEPTRNLAAAPFSDNRLMSSSHRRSSPRTVFAAIVIVLLAIGALVVERMGGWPVLSQSLSTQFRDFSGAAGNANTSDAASAQVAVVAGDGGNANTATSTTELLPEPGPAAAVPKIERVEPVIVDKANTAANTDSTVARPRDMPAADVATPESNPPGKNLLVLKVRQDSWVEVREGRNALISRLMKGGSTEQVEITEPASLTLGNAAGVDVTFRGKPLEIKADAKNNVARLSLK